MATHTRPSPASTAVRIDEVLRQLVAGLRDAYRLSDDRQTVAHLVLYGCNSYAIANRLDRPEAEILAQIRGLFEVTGTGSREELMRVALRTAGQREAADVPVGDRRSQAPRVAVGAVTRPAYQSRTQIRHARAWPIASGR